MRAFRGLPVPITRRNVRLCVTLYLAKALGTYPLQ